MLAFAGRQAVSRISGSRLLSTAARPVRKAVTMEERAALRAARKERATRTLQQLQGGESASSTTNSGGAGYLDWSRWVWYLGVAIPTGLLVWGFQDENSPPAKFTKWIGLTDFVASYSDDFAKPSFDKLLPDWAQVRCQHQ
jgi:hypothetical protein